MTDGGGQITAKNVVVMTANYIQSPIDRNTPDAQMLGSNAVVIFSGGTVRTGIWLRFQATDRIEFYDGIDTLNELRLQPGRTFIELPAGSRGHRHLELIIVVSTTVRVGIVGTSWWADAMYLPPLTNHPGAEVVAVCGRRSGVVEEFADRWSIPHRFTDHEAMFDSGLVDAVVVSTSNDSHRDITMAALDRGLHVLCEKPLAQNVAQAEEMTAKAAPAGVITMVPFTYSFMPVFQYARRLVAEGYVGRVHHVNMRYYTAYAFDSAYTWRFDNELAGSGVIGDLASHWVYVARWLLDDTETSVGALASTFVEREPRPDGSPYEQGEDSVVLTVRYESGAYGILQTCAVSWEGTEPFGQTHHLEIHGDAGTIYGVCDWETVQEVRGVRRGERAGAGAPDSRRHLAGSSPRHGAQHVSRRVPRDRLDDPRLDHGHPGGPPGSPRLHRRPRRPARARRRGPELEVGAGPSTCPSRPG